MNAGIEEQGSFARTALIFCAFFALVALAYFFVDRPLAEALRPHLSGVRVFVWLTYISKPLTLLSSIVVAAIGVRAMARRTLTPAESVLLRLCCGILIAGVLTYELKIAFGRTWPETWVDNNPSYFGNGTYGFFPFHGGRGYASFPSGHTTAIAAFAGAVWLLLPRIRWVGILLAVAVAVGLLGANYHWLSDIMAGAIVGGTTGATAALIGRQHQTPGVP
ncbi:MAG: phosphatase PAP2 family protein [Rhodomicrobium sp.]|nr:phosphatase PAP2 family protein [Rhodomicrobium sp.]